MTLADKMFCRAIPGCGFGTDCRKRSDHKFFDDLFADDWEALVIRHDAVTNKYNWSTLSGEAVNAGYNAKPAATACC